MVASEQALTFQNNFSHHVRKAAYHTIHHDCRTLCYNLFHPTSLQSAEKNVIHGIRINHSIIESININIEGVKMIAYEIP